MKTIIKLPILFTFAFLLMKSLIAQTQLDIQGNVESPDTVAIIKANYTDMGLILLNSVIGLYVESKYEVSVDIFDGIAGYFNGGSRGIIARSQNGKGVFGDSEYGVGVHGQSIFGHGIVGETQNTNAYAGYFKGNVKIDGAGHGIIFPDGSKQTEAFTGLPQFYTTTSPDVQVFEDLIPPKTSRVVSCQCNEGDFITGGGWDAWRNGTDRSHDFTSNAYYNRPVWTTINGKSTGGWEIGFRNNTADHFYRVKVYCLCATSN